MAERLTTKMNNGHYKGNDIPLEIASDKLGKLEDILEEFNISSIDELHEYLCWEQEQRKELDKIYNVWEKYGCKTLQEVDDLLQDGCDAICILKENSKLEADRDAWKKACELACDILMPKSEIKTIQLNDDNQIRNSKEAIDYFYQQAKQFAGR